MFAGLRLGEFPALRWRDVDLTAGWLTVGEAKTDAGVRRVKIRPALREALLAYKLRSSYSKPNDLVFPSTEGQPQSPSNFRNRIPAKVIERANARLAERGEAPLPSITPHSLRRTFASLLYAIGEPPLVVMQEMGHTNPALALSIYAQTMRRDADEDERLRVLIEPPAPEVRQSQGRNHALTSLTGIAGGAS